MYRRHTHHRQRHNMRRVGLAMTVVSIVATSVTVNDGAAGADVLSGALGVKSAGSQYAGALETSNVPTSEITRTVKAGQAGSFTLKVVNNGTVSSAYRLLTMDASTEYHLLSGTSDVTSQSSASPGFETPVIAAGKFKLYTLKVIPPAGAPTNVFYSVRALLLPDGGGYAYGQTVAYVTVSATKSTNDDDMVVTTPGQKPVLAANPGENALSSATVKSGGTAKFTLKMRNDTTATSAPLSFTLLDYSPALCGLFTVTAKLGTNDVTSSAEHGGYAITPLAAGKSTTVTLTVTNVRPWAHACGHGNYTRVEATLSDGTSRGRVLLFTNAA